ncbi:MAG: isochorismatase family protein [Pseudomonadota bacterium]|nr:isochorismatase family protein [Pseudomonadota bacterium]
MRLIAEHSFLLVIDVQAQLAPHIAGSGEIVTKCAALMRAARLLQIPVRVTEHCANRIGGSVPDIAALIDPRDVLSKTHFCCTDEAHVTDNLREIGRKQAVVAGMEAHVCAMQAALGLAEQGYQCSFVQDAAGSRRPLDHAAAIERMRMSNVQIVTTEMVMFEWLKRADVPEFRELLKIVKSF